MSVSEQRKADLIDYALSAFKFGFVPIPLRDKIPVVRGWPELRNNKIEDEADIAKGNYPKNVRRVRDFLDNGMANNIGIVTGEASGVVVLDLDYPNGVNTWNNWIEQIRQQGYTLPNTFTVRTGGGGLHIYFKYDPRTAIFRNLNKITKTDIDFRTNGGQIIFPGSINVKTGQPYLVVSGYDGIYPTIAEMPEWLRQILYADMISKNK